MAIEKLTGNMLIAQSGGPSVVINQSLVGAVQEAKKHAQIKKIIGALHGIKGILEENLIDLRKETAANLELVAQTPPGNNATTSWGRRSPANTSIRPIPPSWPIKARAAVAPLRPRVISAATRETGK